MKRRSWRPSLFPVLDRYVVREVLAPTVVGFITYTFLLLMRAIFGLMEQIFVRGVSAADALRLLKVTVPHVAVLTIPMAFLFGVLIAVGRMNSENEVVALQAGGISTGRVLRSIVVLGVALTALNGYLTVVVMPRANRELRELKVRLFSSAKVIGQIEPRVFYEGFPNLLLYVRDIDPDTGYWKGVILYDRSQSGEDRLVVARRGRLVSEVPSESGKNGASSSATGEPWLRLEDVVTHEFNPARPETYRVNVNRTQLHKLFPKEAGSVSYSLGMRELSTARLLRIAGVPLPVGTVKEPGRPGATPTQRRLALVELHKRLAIPAACIAFAFIALPLGIGTRSGGRGRGFLLSIGVILVYYIMLNNGEVIAREGRVPPWVGVWAPNLVLIAVALFLMHGMARWLGEKRRRVGLFARLLERRGGRRRGAVPEARTARTGVPLTGSIPVALQRRQTRTTFPTLLDRYLTTRLMAPLALVLGSTAALYIVVDLADKIDEVAKHKASFGIFLAYYWNLIPQVALDVTPFAILIGVLIVLTLLERNLELTSLKAGGISLYRVVVPIVLVALACAIGLGILEESVVPRANRKAAHLLDRIMGRETARSYAAADRQWLFSRDGMTLYNFLRFDAKTSTLIRFTSFRFDDSDALRLQLFADRARYTNGSWMADSGWFRQIYPDGTDEFRRITRPMELDVPESPSYFAHKYQSPSQMSFRDLRRYIHELAASGYRPVQLIVRLHQKLTYPLSAFVMVLLALPFGLNRSGGRRLSSMQGVALALGLGIAYFVLVALAGKMGEANILPPVVGAWLPPVLATLFAANRLTTLRT